LTATVRGDALAAVGMGLLLVARRSAVLLRCGLASGFAAACMLVASVFAYQTPG
jgi:hypothetical protein